MFDISHLVTFVVGTAVGAAGQYMADRFTDQRRKQEINRESDRKFKVTLKAMPKLLSEMKADLIKHETEVVREFVLLQNRRVMFNSDRTRFVYYHSVHADLENQVAMLVEHGYIRKISITQTPIYRMTEDFVQRVKRAA